MKAFWAIVRLTFRNAIRSHIFQLLLLLLLLGVVLIPGTVSGDGTARGFIRISLLYSLSAVSYLLAFSSVWLGCFVMTQDQKIRPDAFTEDFTEEKLASVLFSLMLSALLRQDYDPSTVLEMVRRLIY